MNSIATKCRIALIIRSHRSSSSSSSSLLSNSLRPALLLVHSAPPTLAPRSLLRPARSITHRVAASMGNQTRTPAKNVLGGELGCCCTSPVTGFYRDGYCHTGPSDFGRHVVCSQVTEEFLTFTASRGNPLGTPNLAYGFPGLKPGDRWCLCASRWKEALDAGCAPPVVLSACHENALKIVTMEELRSHALEE